MIFEADSKRPGESPIYSMEIARELALVPGDTIVSVTTAIAVKSGADPDVGVMLVRLPAFSATTISQRVRAGVSGNVYFLKFVVVTAMQTLEFVVLVPVLNEGAA